MIKLVQKKKVVLMICAAVLLILWALTLIFGNREDKTMVLVLSLISQPVIYGLARLMFKVIRSKVSLKFIKIFSRLFLIIGVFGAVMGGVYFITGFPNGLSPTLIACLGWIVAMLAEAKKDTDIKDR